VEQFPFRITTKNFEYEAADLSFPSIQTGDQLLDSVINTDLKNRFTCNQYPTEPFNSALIKWASYGAVFLDFKVNSMNTSFSL
jgi:hypothetical protein